MCPSPACLVFFWVIISMNLFIPAVCPVLVSLFFCYYFFFAFDYYYSWEKNKEKKHIYSGMLCVSKSISHHRRHYHLFFCKTVTRHSKNRYLSLPSICNLCTALKPNSSLSLNSSSLSLHIFYCTFTTIQFNNGTTMYY